jgi:hypothetical protein
VSSSSAIYIDTRNLFAPWFSPVYKHQMLSQVFDVSITPFLAAIGCNDKMQTPDMCKSE